MVSRFDPLPMKPKRILTVTAVLVMLGSQPTMAGATPIGKADIERWTEAWNSHDITKVEDLFSQDVSVYQTENPRPLNKASLRGFFAMIFKAYPDFRIVVEDALI